MHNENKINLSQNIINNRYIQNSNYLNAEILNNQLDTINYRIIPMMQSKLETFIFEQIQNSPLGGDYSVNSLGQKESDYSIYTGIGSNTYVFWRYYLYSNNKKEISIDALEYFKITIETNIKNVLTYENYNQKKFNKIPPSFFMGPVGTYTMGCIYYSIQNDYINFQNCLANVLKYHKSVVNNFSESELLYGSAGYIYSLLLIQQNCKNVLKGQEEENIKEFLLDSINQLFKEGIASMKLFNSDILIWPWPKLKTRKLEDIYLGAAHGVVGILYMLLKGLKSLDLLIIKNEVLIEIKNKDFYETINNYNNLLKKSLDDLLEYRFQSGNLPSSIGKEKDTLVHFCHGETGFIILYLYAYKVFQDEKFLEAALKSGEDLWKRGILLKGNGICHGISGGAYALYSLFKTTKETKWRLRSFLFANAILDENVQTLCRKYEDPQRIVVGIPDSPYSLMEGNGGVICLFSDILNECDSNTNENLAIRFPGFEI